MTRPDDPIERMIDSWADPSHPPSKHLEWAITAVVHRQRRNLPPLRDSEPVPGCNCPRCTGVSADAPSRMVPIISRYRRAAYRQPLNVEAARAVPILDVARRLDLGEPRRAGRELHVRCPLHEDRRPSMRLNPTKGTWFCDVCSEGGDSIRLLMRARGLDFPAAVRELAA